VNTSIGIPNQGAMSEFVAEFDVSSCLTEQTYHCRFSHLWNGVATRHSDSVDTKFLVDGRGVVVGLAHPGFVQFTKQSGRNLSDREASYVAPNICVNSSSRRRAPALRRLGGRRNSNHRPTRHPVIRSCAR